MECTPHVYACLVCGKYYRGRGKQTPAYRHSVDCGHYVFVHLTNATFWCLPENYEIIVINPEDRETASSSATDGVNINSNGNSQSLLDIRYALRPKFTIMDVTTQLDTNVTLTRDIYGARYLPGYVGLNNVGGKSDYVNAIVQALAHVTPIRNYFLLLSDNDNNNDNNEAADDTITSSLSSPLVQSFSLLLRNIWSSRRFKSTVDPYNFVQCISSMSNGRYRILGQNNGRSGDGSNNGGGGGGVDASEFLSWLLHQLHVGVGGGVGVGGKKDRKKKKKKKKRMKHSTNDTNGGGSSIIHDTFGGHVEVTTIIRKRQRRGEEAALIMLSGGGITTEADDSSNNNNTTVDGDDDRDGSDDEETIARRRYKSEALTKLANEVIITEEETMSTSNFLQLTLDIPEKPLFRDANGGLVIPQEPLVNVLRKFDGLTFGDALTMQQQQEQQQSVGGGEGVTIISKSRRYRLRKLPNYLILHLNRFKRNGFNIEKNPTIVMFPVKNFDLSSYIFSDNDNSGGSNSDGDESKKNKIPTKQEIENMSIGELRNLLLKYNRSDLVNDVIEKSDLIKHALDFCLTSLPDLLTYKYDLVANITHDTPIEVGREGKQRNPLDEGRYRCHVQHGITGQWYEMEDLAVRETMPQLISVSESYILIFERKKTNTIGLGKT